MFPTHIRWTIEHQPMLCTPQEFQALRVAAQTSPDLRAAVWDDLQCLRATKLLADSFPEAPFSKEAMLVWADYGRTEHPAWLMGVAMPGKPFTQETARAVALIEEMNGSEGVQASLEGHAQKDQSEDETEEGRAF